MIPYFCQWESATRAAEISMLSQVEHVIQLAERNDSQLLSVLRELANAPIVSIKNLNI